VILLWGLEGDEPMAAVRRALDATGAPTVFLDHEQAPRFRIRVGFNPADGGRVSGPEASVELGGVTAAYLRPYPYLQLSGTSAPPATRALRRAVEFEDILWSWAELTPARVVNRPTAMASNNSKPYQARLLQAAGFRTPATLLTTDPTAARRFVRRHGAVIYKSISGVRSVVRRLGPGELDRLEEVTWCPTQFQEFIAGRDYRVHVVGSEVIATAVTSECDDYRYGPARMAPAELPDEVAAACRRLASGLRLAVCGIDLRRTEDGQWFCFEANPSPAFSCFEAATGQPIAACIARFLRYGDT
jgi:hypothetical protein